MRSTRGTRMWLFALCALGAVGLTSCSSVAVRLKSNAAGDNFAQTPDRPEFEQTESMSALGQRVILVEEEDARTGEIGTLHSVVIRNNFFYDLAGVLTFGLWRPVDVEYYLTRLQPVTQDP